MYDDPGVSYPSRYYEDYTNIKWIYIVANSFTILFYFLFLPVAVTSPLTLTGAIVTSFIEKK